jgi:hypothetical protein
MNSRPSQYLLQCESIIDASREANHSQLAHLARICADVRRGFTALSSSRIDDSGY